MKHGALGHSHGPPLLDRRTLRDTVLLCRPGEPCVFPIPIEVCQITPTCLLDSSLLKNTFPSQQFCFKSVFYCTNTLDYFKVTMELKVLGCAMLFPLQIFVCVLRAAVRLLTRQKRRDLGADVVLITGGGRGIGRHLAKEFAKQGAKKVQLLLSIAML